MDETRVMERRDFSMTLDMDAEARDISHITEASPDGWSLQSMFINIC